MRSGTATQCMMVLGSGYVFKIIMAVRIRTFLLALQAEGMAGALGITLLLQPT